MDDPSFSVSSSPPASRREPSSSYEEDDEEDLGFGNSKKPETEKANDDSEKSSEPAKTVAPERPGKHTASLFYTQSHLSETSIQISSRLRLLMLLHPPDPGSVVSGSAPNLRHLLQSKPVLEKKPHSTMTRNRSAGLIRR
jgi:hypothetical protein